MRRESTKSIRNHIRRTQGNRGDFSYDPPLSLGADLLPPFVRIRSGLVGADRSRRTLEVARANRKGTRCIQMSSNWGTPRRNLRDKTKNKQRTNRRNLPERLRNGTMECLYNRKLVLQCPCRGNDKELSYLIINLSGYPQGYLQHLCEK